MERTMSRTDTKQSAQDKLMQRLADALLLAAEDGEPIEMLDEMRRQAARIGKLFGYTSWPGIGRQF